MSPNQRVITRLLLVIIMFGLLLFNKYTAVILDIQSHPYPLISSLNENNDFIRQGGIKELLGDQALGADLDKKVPSLKVGPDPRPGKTHVTYNTTLVIQCPESSPFVRCYGRPSPRSDVDKAADRARHKPWKFTLVKKERWMSKMNFRICPYDNCEDAGRDFSDDTDVLIFFGTGLNRLSRRPPRAAGSSQIWVFANWESPINTHATFMSREKDSWNDAINMTMTYRVDSDVFIPYRWLNFDPQPLEERPNYYKIAKKKSKDVVWLVGNCKTQSKREAYVRKLKQYIDVDILGACGRPSNCPRYNPVCAKPMMAPYKFYLSFENSICTDYVSEKYFKVYSSDYSLIPVVRGGADYLRYFPANTFINAADFDSPRHLAEHLMSLGSDTERYAQMLEQKDLYRPMKSMRYMWCSLCEYFNTRGTPRQSVNLKNWWSDGHCHAPNDF